ncbi:hypothetical protein GCM10011575_25840 [Microlunatus endophyticus]|uniref:Uncharacterized protein n=2 Tax=Microlunatus endophyticus TaxID=1716077 RepID=A0A917S9Y0_9ACTN|nr:hypothetical protein GCM10011575_25840 [Microlunatus endophyticus]
MVVLRSFVIMVIVEPILEGRLRNRSWPYGLAGVAVVGSGLYVLGLITTVLAATSRTALPLSVDPSLPASALPRPLLGLIMVMLIGIVALVQSAGLHGPWWLRLLSLAVTEIVIGIWGLHVTGFGPARLLFVPVVLIMIGMLVLVIIRAGRSYAWWEFPLVLVLVGAAIISGVLQDSFGVAPLGFDLARTSLLETLSLLGVLAVPALFAAGTAVAELTVRASVSAGKLLQRIAGRRVLYPILGVVAAARLAKLVYDFSRWDRVEIAAPTIISSVVVMIALAAALLMIDRIAVHDRQRDDHEELADLSEHASRTAFPIGVGLVAVQLPLTIAVFGLTIVIALDPQGRIGWLNTALIARISSPDVVRALRAVVGAVVLAVAIRSARRGNRRIAMLLGATAILLGAGLLALVPGLGQEDGFNLSVFDLVAGAGILITIIALAVARRLTRERAAVLTVAVVLSGLVASRDFISDPVGAVLGYSGVGLALFGLTWDLLTGSAWANTAGRRIGIPSRVMLLFANSVFGLLVVAFGAMARVVPAAIPDSGQWASLGDWLVGTALVATVLAALIEALRDGRLPR